jgi:hypothetical protein
LILFRSARTGSVPTGRKLRKTAYRERIESRWKSQILGDIKEVYKFYAEAVDGVRAAHIVRAPCGPGSTDVIIASVIGLPNEELVNKVKAALDGRALGLGSQVSQIAAIYYPNMLDYFIKEKLRIKFYGRYMDDLYLIHRDKQFLEHCLSEIQKVCAALKITVNMKKTCITKLSHGLIFLKGKYSLLESGKVLRLPCRDSPIRMKRKLKKFKTLLEAGKMNFMDVRNAYQSWRGAFKKRFQAYKKVSKIDALYDSLFL